MTKLQFEVIKAVHQKKINVANPCLEKSGISEKELLDTINYLQTQNLVSKDLSVTELGYEAMKPYKVDNAIIMAAGISSRCLPLSNVIPKGLFKINGEILIEREIEQLKASGINQIILVVGYLKELFFYLKEKYDIIIIENSEFNTKNNIHSLYLARDYMKNSYICCSDNYFTENVFSDYVYDSYYACKYSDSYVDEFCITKMDGDYIKEVIRGGEKKWYTMGEAYFNKSFSAKFIELLNSEYHDTAIHKMLMDDYHIKHINVLKLCKKEYGNDKVYEFDTLQEILDFDKDFFKFILEFFPVYELHNETQKDPWQNKYDAIKRYNAIPTEQRTGRLHLNENLFKPSPKCFDVLKSITYEDLYLYDLAKEDALEVELSDYLQLPVGNIFIHNGSSEVIKTILSIVLNKGDKILLPAPNWSYYKSVADVKFAHCEYYDVLENDDVYYHDVEGILHLSKKLKPKMIVITTPHMPTGNVISEENLEKIICANQNSLILVDEAYLGFSDHVYDVKTLITKYQNVVFSRTFSKFFGLANMRIGYCLCSENAKSIFGLDLPLFKTSVISRNMAIAALRDKEYYTKLKNEVIDIRDWFINELNKISGVKAYQSYSNFVFIHLEGYDAQKMKDWMEANGILIRIFTEKGKLAMRITIAPLEIMNQVLSLFSEAFKINVC